MRDFRGLWRVLGSYLIDFKVIWLMKRILDFIKSLFSRNIKAEVYRNTIKGSHIYGNVSLIRDSHEIGLKI